MAHAHGVSMGTGGHMGLKGRSCLAGGVEPCKFGGPIPHVAGRFMSKRLDQGGRDEAQPRALWQEEPPWRAAEDLGTVTHGGQWVREGSREHSPAVSERPY